MGLFNRKKPEPAPKPKVLVVNPRAFAGGRVSTDGWKDGWVSSSFAVVEPDNYEEDWRMLQLDSETLSKIGVDELMVSLASISPDISRAVWDFERMSNAGWTVEARRIGASDDEPVDPVAQAAVDAFIEDLRLLHTSPDVLWNKMFLGAFLRGAFVAELILDSKGRMPLDIATPDPATIRFKRTFDTKRGAIWIPGQWQNGRFVELRRPTFLYVPVDAMPGSPYGRSPAAPGLFTALFLVGILHDLRRVVSQQGYPRLDVEVDLEKLAAAMPADLEGDPEAFMKWVDGIVSEVQRVYSTLEPDDAYVHTSTIKVNRPVGTVDSNSLNGIEGIIKSLERMAIKSLKTVPLLMGVNEASTETHAARQWEVYVQGVRSFQHLAEHVLERLFTLALQAQGIQAQIKFRFAELRNSEELRDAQTMSIKLANAKAAYESGFVSQDAAAMMAIGKGADQPEPREVSSANDALEKANDTMNESEGPKDSQKRSLPEDEVVTITDDDVAKAVARWDAALSTYAGLLDAELDV